MLTRRKMLIGSLSCSAFLPFGTNLFAQGTSQYEEIDVPGDAGRISGSIKYDGPPIETPKMLVTKDSSICGEGLRNPAAVRIADDGSLGDVVVQIRGITRGKAWDPVFDEALIYQIDCSFQPYVQIIRDTANVFVTNYDPIMHNIHAYEVYKGTRRSMFNFSQPHAGQVDQIPLSLRRGNLIEIDCNAHSWMGAWLYTSPNPYLKVTSVDGKFELPDIPPGDYQLAIWHPLLGEKIVDIPVGAKADIQLNLVWT